MKPPDHVPAATVVLFRARPDGGRPELLMLERAATMAFAAGMLVFPGGRVDDGDRALGGGDADRAARIAAIRETIEEAGVAIGLHPAPDRDQIGRLRAGLAAGGDFGGLIAEERLSLSLDRLTPFARWRPEMPHTRNYDTRFYLAEAPEGAVVSVDGTECVSDRWATAETFLADDCIIFPTRRNLERLAQHDDIASAIADARRYDIVPITPWLEMRDGRHWLTIPDDLGYPVTAELMERALRG